MFGTEKGLNSHIKKTHFGRDVPDDETLLTYERVECEELPGKRALLKIYMDKMMLRDLQKQAATLGYPFDVFIFKILNAALSPVPGEMEKILATLAKELGVDILSPMTNTVYKGGTGEPIKLPGRPLVEGEKHEQPYIA